MTARFHYVYPPAYGERTAIYTYPQALYLFGKEIVAALLAGRSLEHTTKVGGRVSLLQEDSADRV